MQFDLEKDAALKDIGSAIKDLALTRIPGLGALPSPVTALGIAGTTADRTRGLTQGMRNTMEAGAKGMGRNPGRYAPNIPRVNRSIGIQKIGFAKHAGHLAALQQYGLLT